MMTGLAYGGAEGVQKIINGTNEELRRAMNLTGSSDIQNIDPELIWH
jgi:isopentenyl diphosphate isomerase/L-lactate dehydrogenase-like FMN-dependent dehydrogenase